MATCQREQIDPEEISSINVETYPIALKLCSIVHPVTPSGARFSLPFSIALALLKGNASADKYSVENVNDAKIQSLAGKVKLSVGSKWGKLYPSKRGAKISVTDTRGKTGFTEMELAIGEPENPTSQADFFKKFYTNATLLISESKAKKLEDAVLNLENVSLAEFVKFLGA